MKISPMVKTVTCITYAALILLSIIILFCVFSSRYESFSSSSCSESPSCIELCSGSGSGSSPSGDGGSSPSGDGGSSPSDSPEDIICDAAGPTRTDWDGDGDESAVDDAYNNTYNSHDNKGCARIEEGKCWKRNIYDPILDEQVYCKWVDGMCKTFQTCSGDAVNNRPQWLPQGTSIYDVDEDGIRRPQFTGKIYARTDGVGLTVGAALMRVVPDTDMDEYLTFDLAVLKAAFDGKWLLIKDVEGGEDKSEVVKVEEVKGVDVGNGETTGEDLYVDEGLGFGTGHRGYIEFKILRGGIWELDQATPLLVPQDNNMEPHAAGTSVVLLWDESGHKDWDSDDEAKPLLIF